LCVLDIVRSSVETLRLRFCIILCDVFFNYDYKLNGVYIRLVEKLKIMKLGILLILRNKLIKFIMYNNLIK